MKWFYSLPTTRRIELEETVWNPTFDAVLLALGSRSRENEEAAIASANAATFRTEYPFTDG